MTHDIPHGLSYADFRRHPVTEALAAASHGKRGLPRKGYLDSLQLPAGARSRLNGECRKVSELYDTGQRADAWKQAQDSAAKILAELPDDYHSPGYLKDLEPDPTDRMNPAELAAHVRGN